MLRRPCRRSPLLLIITSVDVPGLLIMRPPMSKGVQEELKSEITWGEARARSRLVHPKVARWAEEYYNMPYFIKVITKTADTNYHIRNHGAKLTLPTPFIKAHYLKLDKDVTLEDAVTGNTWAVSFQARGYEHWSQGWPEFAQKNNLHLGNTIVFALVSHSRFLFTVFNDQGCQVIHPSRVKQETKTSSEEKGKFKVYRSSFHLPSCPKHHSRKVIQPKVEVQEDGGSNASLYDHEKCHVHVFPAQNVGHDKACQAAISHNDLQQTKRKFKASANSAAQDNHKICIHMGFPCRLHHHEDQKLKMQPVNQIDQCVDSDRVLDQCQKGLEHIQIAECLVKSNQQPLVEERALSVMTMTEADSESGEISDIQPRKAAHLDPIRFTFMSKRRAVTNVERREAKKAASRYSRTLRRPNSITVMKKSHVYKEFSMELPKALVLLGGVVVFPQPALTLVDSIGRLWEMQWYASGRQRLALVPKDWALFAVHHFLEEGDACVFEATDVEALIILVRIFRIVDIPDNLGTDAVYNHYSVELAS